MGSRDRCFQGIPVTKLSTNNLFMDRREIYTDFVFVCLAVRMSGTYIFIHVIKLLIQKLEQRKKRQVNQHEFINIKHDGNRNTEP